MRFYDLRHTAMARRLRSRSGAGGRSRRVPDLLSALVGLQEPRARPEAADLLAEAGGGVGVAPGELVVTAAGLERRAREPADRVEVLNRIRM